MRIFDDYLKQQIDHIYSREMLRAAVGDWSKPFQCEPPKVEPAFGALGSDSNSMPAATAPWFEDPPNSARRQQILAAAERAAKALAMVPVAKEGTWETSEQRWARIKSEAGLPAETDHAAVERIRQAQAEATAKRNAARLIEEQWRREHPEEDEISEGLRCYKCKQPFNEYRLVAHGGYGEPGYCGDCATVAGTIDQRIAEAQPKPEPERPGAWMTPTWDGEW